MYKAAWILLASLFLVSASQAHDPRVLQSHAVTVELYDSNPENPESMSVRVRDVSSNKNAQIFLNRKAADQKVWAGFFLIQFFKGDNSPRVLEFLNSKLTPYFVYFSMEGGKQKVKLYPTAAEMKADLEELKIVTPAVVQKKIEITPPVQPAAPPEVVAAPLPPVPAVPKISLQELEAKKRLRELEESARLSKAEKEKKKEQAADLIKKADARYKAENYSEAERLYAEALRLDPENTNYLFRYGVSLYKTDQYEKSLVNLAIAEVPAEQLLEKDYYVALNHLKLKNYPVALKKLIEIREEEDVNISPTASYLAGTVELQKQQYADARKSMEYVIDKSKDPQLDKAAEEMLDQIDKIENYLASKKERYRFTFFAGPVYDQNVLNMATNNISTDVQAFRANYGATALGYLYRSMSDSLAAQFSFSDYYSTTTSLKSDATLQAADPLDMTITLPYKLEATLGSRPLNWDFTPSYKSILMSATGSSRSELIRSVGASTSISGPYQKDIFITSKLDYSSDTSNLTVTSSDDVQSGTKMGLTITPTFLLNTKGDQSLSTDLSYLTNTSQGKNYRYTRIGLGATYATPIFWSSNGTLRLDYSSQNYGQATTPRTDTSINLTGGLNKDLTKQWNLSSTLQYTIANSDVDTYKYNKLMLMGVFTYTFTISDK